MSDQEKPKPKTPKMVSVTFTGSPTGLLKLAYSKGDTAKVTEDQREILLAAKLIEVPKLKK